MSGRSDFYFIDYETRPFMNESIKGIHTGPHERIALEYFEPSIGKWVCTSIVPENTRYRIRRETGTIAVTYDTQDEK